MLIVIIPECPKCGDFETVIRVNEHEKKNNKLWVCKKCMIYYKKDNFKEVTK